MSDIDPQEFGRMQAHVETLVTSVKTLTEKVEAIDQRMAEARGGWKLLMFLGGSAGAAGAGLGAWVTHWLKGGGPIS